MLSSNQRYFRLAPRVGPPQRDVLTTETPPEETLSTSCLVMSLFLIMSHPLLFTCDGDLTDEPTSPSTDLQACNVPACSVVSSSQACTMASLTSTSVPPTLSSVSPFVRLRSQDCSESHSPTLNPERHYWVLDQYTVCLPACQSWHCQTLLPVLFKQNDKQLWNAFILAHWCICLALASDSS